MLVIGDVMLDRYLWGAVTRISPEAPVPIVNIADTTVALGGAANVAANIAGFGSNAILVGVCGEDAEATTLGELLSAARIENAMHSFGDRPTTVKSRVVAHSQHVVRFDYEESRPLTDVQSSSIIDAALLLLGRVEVVVVSDYAKGVLTDAVLSEIVVEARKKRVRVLVDPKGKDYLKYRGATILTPNRREAAEAANLEEGHPDLVTNAGKDLLERCELDALLITEGEKGMTLFDRESEPIHFDALARDVYDVTGAGDTVIAAMAVSLGAGTSFSDAAEIANIAAGLAVEEVGTAVISKEALLDRLSSPRTAR